MGHIEVRERSWKLGWDKKIVEKRKILSPWCNPDDLFEVEQAYQVAESWTMGVGKKVDQVDQELIKLTK